MLTSVPETAMIKHFRLHAAHDAVWEIQSIKVLAVTRLVACNLIMEYTLSCAAVARGFSSYLATLAGLDPTFFVLKVGQWSTCCGRLLYAVCIRSTSMASALCFTLAR